MRLNTQGVCVCVCMCVCLRAAWVHLQEEKHCKRSSDKSRVSVIEYHSLKWIVKSNTKLLTFDYLVTEKKRVETFLFVFLLIQLLLILLLCVAVSQIFLVILLFLLTKYFLFHSGPILSCKGLEQSVCLCDVWSLMPWYKIIWPLYTDHWLSLILSELPDSCLCPVSLTWASLLSSLPPLDTHVKRLRRLHHFIFVLEGLYRNVSDWRAHGQKEKTPDVGRFRFLHIMTQLR